MFEHDRDNEGTIDIRADPLLLGVGQYLVTVSVFCEGYFASPEAKKFFSTNQGVYDMHSRAYEIAVLPDLAKPLNNDVVFLHEARWSKESLALARS
jgi:hypothetical protein